MSGLAQIYHHLGYQVSGSDIKDSQIIRRLKKGIKIKLNIPNLMLLVLKLWFLISH